MKTPIRRWGAIAILLLCFAGLLLVGAYRRAQTAPGTRARLDQLKARFAMWAGHMWFETEEFAGGIYDSMVSRRAAMQNRVFPDVAPEPLPTPSGAVTIQLEEEREQGPGDREG